MTKEQIEYCITEIQKVLPKANIQEVTGLIEVDGFILNTTREVVVFLYGVEEGIRSIKREVLNLWGK